MTRISKIRVKQMPEKQLLSMRRTIDFFTEYSDLMAEALEKIDQILKENELLPASGPVVCFHTIDLAALDVEIGLEVAIPVTITGAEVQCKTVPSQRIAVTIDRGPYEEQDPTLEALLAWVKKQGYSITGRIHYHYLNDEEQQPTDYLTEMYIPISN